jgi:hypothetical protein
MLNKKVLIVTYSQSTKISVGSRRWIKYSHRLANLGHHVTIICCDKELSESEKNDKIKYLTFSTSYPSILNKNPKNVLNKLQYKIALFRQKSLTKGLIYDKAILDEMKILNIIQNEIDNYGINNIIVSGAPFSLLYFGAKIKNKNPEINFIADIRDPWTWGHGYGIKTLNKYRFNVELNREKFVIEKADQVIVASKDMEIFLKSKYMNFLSKINTISNGIEKNTKQIDEIHDKSNIDSLKILHIGTVNEGTEKYWKFLFESTLKLNFSFEITFIGNFNVKFENYVRLQNFNNVFFHERIFEIKLINNLIDADCFLMFKKDGFENSFPSKYFDYIKYKKPIICFSKEGIVTEEIENNKIGKVFNENSDKNELVSYLVKIYNGNQVFNKSYDWSKFTIEKLFENFEKLLL